MSENVMRRMRMDWMNALKKNSMWSALFAAASAAALTACGPVGETVDDTAVEPDRETRIQRISGTACDRFVECGDVGEDELFESYEACLDEQQDNFRDLWPADECNDGQIDDDSYRDCDVRAETYPCDSNVFDFLSYYSQCDADDVCTDPRQ
jgi:hypothetical protein